MRFPFSWLRSLALIAALLCLDGLLPSAGLHAAVRRLDVLILVYTRSFAHTLTEPQLERLHEEIAEFADFYQSHGGNRVEFHFTLLQLDRELRQREVSQIAPGRYYLSRENVEAELEALGMRGRFDEVVAFYAWNNANPAAAALAYGGGAVGPDGGFLGDAGYNSIGVFAWDPARIAQVAVHEVLHNLDDMFSRSGMAEEFFNSDEMSRNMPLLLGERPGAFLPWFTDPEMLAYAQRELVGKEMYPWWMQRIYYAWMLERTPARDWDALRYGRMVTRRPAVEPRPLYDAIYLSRATPRVFVPVLGANGRMHAFLRGNRTELQARRYALQDFDGTPLVEQTYHAGWVDTSVGATQDIIRYAGMTGSTSVQRVRMGDIVAPAFVLARGADRRATFAATVLEAGWPQYGDTVRTSVSVAGAGADVASGEAKRHTISAAAGDATLRAAAKGFWIAPLRVAVEGRGDWSIDVPPAMETTLANPLGLAVSLRDRRPIDAEVTATVAGRKVPLARLADDRYYVTVDGLDPGLHTAEIRAARPDGSTQVDRVTVYARPGGWIRSPTALEVTAGAPARLEVSVRSRMGDVLRGLRLPLIAIANQHVVHFTEDEHTGTYSALLPLPEGEHRVFVTSLEGEFQRRVVIVRVHGGTTAATPTDTLRGTIGALPYAVAVRSSKPPVLDGEIGEWQGRALRLDAGSHRLTDSTLYRGANDLSARLWFAWDDSTLYIAGQVRDDSVTPGEAWDRDRVNLVLDWRENDTPLTYGEDGAAEVAEWQADDYWLFFQPFWSAAAPGVPWRMDRTGTHSVKAATLRTRRTAEGYTFELAVPAAELPEFAPFPGHVAALQVFVTDGDAERQPTELMWSHRWRYSADGLAWELPRMGRLVFVDGAL